MFHSMYCLGQIRLTALDLSHSVRRVLHIFSTIDARRQYCHDIICRNRSRIDFEGDVDAAIYRRPRSRPPLSAIHQRGHLRVAMNFLILFNLSHALNDAEPTVASVGSDTDAKLAVAADDESFGEATWRPAQLAGRLGP